MISFGQFVILLLLALLLFGDVRKIFKKFILFFVNLKTLYKKSDSTKKEKK
jgi:hypothetical protein